MDYRLADKNDFEKLTEIRIKYIEEDFGELSAEVKEKILLSLPGYFSRHLNRDLFAFLAEEKRSVVSSAFLLVAEKPANPRFPNGRIGEVLNVYTLPQYRRRGIAGNLMKMLVRAAGEKKLDFVRLKATESGYPLYKRLGFTEDADSYISMKLTFD